MDKKLLVCIVIILILAGTVSFFVLRDFGILGGRDFRGGFNNNNFNDASVLLPRIKTSLGLPADATDAQVKEALGLPQDANFEQIRNAFIQKYPITRPQGGN
ncbi:MAG: hypothetical protein PHD95_00425 [Candidatus ainarchaeum sp.]|nr:hypothetical protein [Candidatus ainarchaeum sp.]